MNRLLAALCLAALPLCAHAQEAKPAAKGQPAAAKEMLGVGSPAPAVRFAKFYKGEAVVALDPQQTYVVECWATWCGPCVRAFPHLTQIAKDTAGKATVIGVDVWEQKPAEEVQAFVDKQGERMGYRVAGDADGAIADGWLKAAGKNGIPCAFVVVKGKIAWIGHPGELSGEMVLALADGKDIKPAQEAERKANDAEKFQGYLQSAHAGDASSMHSVGYLYATGELGVAKDAAKAYCWFRLGSLFSKDEKFQKVETGWSDALAKKLTPEQLQAAQAQVETLRQAILKETANDAEKTAK